MFNLQWSLMRDTLMRSSGQELNKLESYLCPENVPQAYEDYLLKQYGAEIEWMLVGLSDEDQCEVTREQGTLWLRRVSDGELFTLNSSSNKSFEEEVNRIVEAFEEEMKNEMH